MILLSQYDSSKYDLCECKNCSFRYLDAPDTSQAHFDQYYRLDYRTDDLQWSGQRLSDLARFIAGLKPSNVLDIGGMDGELKKHLNKRNIPCDIAGVGVNVAMGYDLVVLSHTLEHIYDVDAMFALIKTALTRPGYLVVEIPIHLGYLDPASYDYHWQHINKFRPGDIEKLFERHGFAVTYSHRADDYREYKTWRIAGCYADE